MPSTTRLLCPLNFQTLIRPLGHDMLLIGWIAGISPDSNPGRQVRIDDGFLCVKGKETEWWLPWGIWKEQRQLRTKVSRFCFFFKDAFYSCVSHYILSFINFNKYVAHVLLILSSSSDIEMTQCWRRRSSIPDRPQTFVAFIEVLNPWMALWIILSKYW